MNQRKKPELALVSFRSEFFAANGSYFGRQQGQVVLFAEGELK